MKSTRWRMAAGVVILVFGLFAVTGCTPEKAKAVRLAAEQFSTQSLIAIKAMEETWDAELAPAPRSAQEQATGFVEFLSQLDLKELNEQGEDLTFATLNQAANPDAYDLDEAVKAAREKYLRDLKQRYTTFAGMLDGLERGSFFVADELEKAQGIGQRLTADMASIAKHFTKHPPQLIQQRGDVLVQVLDIKENDKLSAQTKKDRLALIKPRYDQLVLDERKLLKNVLEPSLKAAELGYELDKMVAGYTQLTVADVQDMLLRSVKIVGELTGRDMGDLIDKSEMVFSKISTDPVLESVAGQVMDELNQCIENR